MKVRFLAVAVLAAVLCLASPHARAADKPNILLIVADDMGWSDAGVYGGEIYTPNINRLANQGYQFLNFHVGSMCAPTRSMVMTGVDNHIVAWATWWSCLPIINRANRGTRDI